MLEGWLGETATEGRAGAIAFASGEAGTFGRATAPLGERERAGGVREASRRLHAELHRFLDGRGHHLARVWNRLPRLDDAAEFERGRDDARPGDAPAATTLGGGDALTVEFFAGAARPRYLDGGTLYDHARRQFLLTGAIAAAGEPGAAVRDAFERLRQVTAHEHLERHGVGYGFRLEDVLELRAFYARPDDRAELELKLRRRLSPDAVLRLERADLRDGARLSIEAVMQQRSGESRRPSYRVENGRVRVEAFELHVVEHCNLRCAHCCNMSPYLDAHVMSVEEIESQCRRMAEHVRADVFKIMGGEPLLHPRIIDILHVLRATGISDVIRLFTNGLLLARMDDDFWRALDHLTVSSYASAPVREDHLALIREKARAFDVVLNVKPVDRFSEVMSRTRAADDAAIQATYDECWLRHRCLIVRGGAFFKCTRAAYFEEYQTRIAVDQPHPDPAAQRRADGVPLDAPDLRERLLAYLNDQRPLGACRWCHGSSGPLVPHTQLTRADVRRGVL
jgi:organic radical activating enzyme